MRWQGIELLNFKLLLMLNRITNAWIKDVSPAIRKAGVVGSLILLFNFIFYHLEYIDKKDEDGFGNGGYYLVKRTWLWLLLSPLIMPIFFVIPKIFVGIAEYFKFCFSYGSHWIGTSKRKLSLREKINFRQRLWD